jgi:hypothetical protein
LREPIQEIMRHAAVHFDVTPRAISFTSRQAWVLKARAMACRLAVAAGHSGAEVGSHPGMTRSEVFAAMKRGNACTEEKK